MAFLSTVLAPRHVPLMAWAARIASVGAVPPDAEHGISSRIATFSPWTLAVAAVLLVAIIAAGGKNLPFAWHVSAAPPHLQAGPVRDGGIAIVAASARAANERTGRTR
jgi:hypothetical protein